MNHNIVIDDHGNEHQAVEDVDKYCDECSLEKLACGRIKDSVCLSRERADNIGAIYKRRIKLSDIIIKS